MANNNKHPELAAAKTAANQRSQRFARPTPEPVTETTRLQRLLLVVGLSILGLGVVCLFVLLIGEAVTPISVSNDSGIWAIVAFIPDIAIPLGMLLIIVLIVLTVVRRGRAAKVASK